MNAQFVVFEVRAASRPAGGWSEGTFGIQGTVRPIESGYYDTDLRRVGGEWKITRHREDFRRLATRHAFADSWSRPGLDQRSRALVCVTIAATLGTREPLRGQLRIALHNGVTKDEIVELFIHLEAYAGPARAFDSYQVAQQVFGEDLS